MRALRRRGVMSCALALSLAAPVAGCGSQGASITIMVAWSGAELTAFDDIADSFQTEYGVHVNVESTRALTQELAAAIQQGQPPDLAALPSLGAVQKYQHDHDLKPIEKVTAGQFPQPWRGLVEVGGHSVVAVPAKVNVQSLIWHDKSSFQAQPPTTWDSLPDFDRTAESAGQTPWCLPVASESTSGWPGADWISELFQAANTTDQYQQWVEGKGDWAKGKVADAWKAWGPLVTDPKALYVPAGGKLLSEAVGSEYGNMEKRNCLLSHGAYVDQGFGTPDASAAGPDAAFTTLRGSDGTTPIEVSGDFVGIFRDSTPAQEFISYLMRSDVQQTWVTNDPGAFSVVSRLKYPNGVLGSIATMLADPRNTLCFDASDAMPPDLSSAFDHAVLQYLADPQQLTSILTGLDRAQALALQKADASPFIDTHTPVCGNP